MRDNILIDDETTKPKKNFYNFPAKMLMLAAIIYAAYLFFYYFELQREMTNPLLPAYTTPYIYGTLALKGGILATGMFFAQIFLILKKYIAAFYLLLLTLIITVSGIYYFVITA